MLSAYLQTHRDQLAQRASATPQPTQFVIEPGTPARTVAQNLQDAGLISDARLFEAYVRANNLGNRLQAGTFTLSPDMTLVQIAEALQNARAAEISVTIPEGWRLEQIADYLNSTGQLNGVAYRRLASEGNLADLGPGSYDFLVGRPAGAGLEGYLFPDTYQLPAAGATAADLIRRQLDDFARRVLPLYEEALSQGRTSLTLHEVITLASIVEREAVVAEERPMIAGVYLNRLR